MRAATLASPRNVLVTDVDDPVIIDATDVIVEVTAACICGSDLWPFRGIHPTAPGQRLGHEFVGNVVEVGADVRTVQSEAIDSLCFGGFEKGALQFSTRWWADGPPAGLHLLTAPVFRYWVDLTEISGVPVLAAHVAGPAAHTLPADPADRVNAAWKELQAVYPQDVPTPTDSASSHWLGDPFTQGGDTPKRPFAGQIHLGCAPLLPWSRWVKWNR